MLPVNHCSESCTGGYFHILFLSGSHLGWVRGGLMGKELLFDQNTSILSLIYMIFAAIVFRLFVPSYKRI